MEFSDKRIPSALNKNSNGIDTQDLITICEHWRAQPC
ncbi:hypothetical protein L917_11973 [Phytophthora nicotianae]|uniref:Uncharacterized protein n=1 Tax=Phytophthora nicotianae TaxID=4792 RepID=W2KUZ7_PHYNI|nr:hypothetical protein L917_11973 [Phytophthora nicotianae]